jgi:acyl carrier protein
MTEAAHQMASNPRPPAQRKAGSVGPAAGPEIAIMDSSGSHLGTGNRGEIVIRGPGVMSGYVNNPVANAAAFHGVWFRTGDEGYLDVEGYLYLTGRLKEMINRAGEKVSPREVDEILLNHPAVLQAVTFAVPHPTIGEDIAAAVVLRPESDVTEAGLREWLFEHITPFKIPSRIIVTDEIPKGATGKIQRIGLHEKFVTALTTRHKPPLSRTEVRLAELWSEVLDIPTPGVADNFFGIGGDSLRAVRVVSRVRESFGIDLEASMIFRMPVIEALAVHIDALCRAREQELLDYVNSLTDEEVKQLLAERQ